MVARSGYAKSWKNSSSQWKRFGSTADGTGLLQSRGIMWTGTIRSYDIDPECESIADMINENWVISEWKFKAHTQDCNKLDPSVNGPDLIINTSTEHFQSREWWDNIPKGKAVALQGNNMPHEDHYVHTESLQDFVKQFPVSKILYAGQKEFVYPDWKFTRYMLIAIK